MSGTSKRQLITASTNSMQVVVVGRPSTDINLLYLAIHSLRGDLDICL